MNFFAKPYPYNAYSPAKIRTVILTGIFVALFMVLFRPFGLVNLKIPYKFLFLSGYGVVTMLVLALMLFLPPRIFKSGFSEKNWTVGKQILYLLTIVLFIGTGNYFYSLIFFRIGENLWRSILAFQGFTLLIGIFPIVTITLFSYNRYLRRNLLEAGDANDRIRRHPETAKHPAGEKIILKSATQNDDPVMLAPGELLFIRSDGNYLEIHFTQNGQLQRRIIRNTLNGIMVKHRRHFPPLFRCHRSYIVNLNAVENVGGNAQGLLLKLKNCPAKVPVSRKFIPAFRQNLA
jgi:hypothetical protein